MIDRKSVKRGNLNEYETEQLRMKNNREKNALCDKLDDIKRTFKKRTQQEKKEKCDNLDDDEKEQFKKYEKKGKQDMK